MNARELLLCAAVAFWVAVLVSLAIGRSSEGAVQVETFDANNNTRYDNNYQDRFARGPNNWWYCIWTPDGGIGLNISWSKNEGSTWYTDMVVNASWEGHTQLVPQGIVVSQNNSIFVVTYTYEGPLTHDTTVWYCWGGDPEGYTWPAYSVCTDSTYTWRNMDVCIRRNPSDGHEEIYMLGHYNSALRHKILDIYDMSISTEGSPILWVSGTNIMGSIAADCNGDVWVAFRFYDGSNWRLYLWSWDQSVKMNYNIAGWSYYGEPCLAFVNGTRAAIALAGYKSVGSYYYLHYFYESVENTTLTRIKILDFDANALDYIYGPGLSITENSTVYISIYDLTDDNQIYWHAAWNASLVTWTSSEANLWTDSSDPDNVEIGQGLHSYWPNVYDGYSGNYSSNIPTSGFAFPWIYRDMPSGPGSEIHYQLCHDVVFHDFLLGDTNYAPTISLLSPPNASSGTARQPWCWISVNDSDGDDFNITWEENSTGVWVERQSNDTVSNGTFWWHFLQAVNYSTTYYWRVTANDTEGNANVSIFHFTTLLNTPPSITNPSPGNGSVGIGLQPWCRVTVTDTGDTFDVSFQENSTGIWVERQTNDTVTDGTFWWRFLQASTHLTVYYWRVDVTDGNNTTVSIFHFTTAGNSPPVVFLPSPSNGSTGVPLVPTCQISVTDTDTMTITWSENSTGVWMVRQTNVGVVSGTHQWTFSQASSYLTVYYWRVVVDDGVGNTTVTYHFTTKSSSTTPSTTDEGFTLGNAFTYYVPVMLVIMLMMLIAIMVVRATGGFSDT
jgi:hypothetical protein